MRDIPVFTTEYGAASLVLKEIPYKGVAYITLQSSMQPEQLLKECVDFCKMTGASKIYATGHPMLEKFPFHTAVIKMQQLRQNLPEGDGALFPVTEETAEDWRSIYNEKMQSISTASTINRSNMKRYLAEGCCYYVHADEKLLGIGIVTAGAINAIAACERGAGEKVFLTLCNAIFSETVSIEVATSNMPAMRLYERLGFQKTAELSRWYEVSE